MPFGILKMHKILGVLHVFFGKSPLDFIRLYLFHSNSELGDLELVGNLGRCRIHQYHA